MYCPKCSQLQISDETRFCSRCGLQLDGLKEIVSDSEMKPIQSRGCEDKSSPRQKGVRQGVLLMLLSLILIPAYILLGPLFPPPNDRLVESAVSDAPFDKISQAVLFTIFMLGVARVLFARFFQTGARENVNANEIAELKDATLNYALPPAHSIPASGFGAWQRNTGEVARPKGVIERTTKSLEVE